MHVSSAIALLSAEFMILLSLYRFILLAREQTIVQANY
jgi:hypothetical protein